MRGELLWFNEERQDGVIVLDDGSKVVVLGSGFAPGHAPEGRCAGLPVSFDLVEESGERRAVSVVVLDDLPVRRARLRGSRSRS
jgi:cold shock CspA family protein